MIRLIAGLGNPGSQYSQTRHNVGFLFADNLAHQHASSLQFDSKFNAETCKLSIASHPVFLIKPQTFMNLSGQSIGAIARYYKIELDEILIVYDELDLDAGTIRLKRNGGHGGHNGLRDTINHLGSREFLRARVGIGHPGHAKLVHSYVLGKPSSADRESIDTSIDALLGAIPRIVENDIQNVMTLLHTQ